MSLAKTLQTNKTVEVNGENVEFGLLDIYDIAKIDEARKAQLKGLAKTNGKENGLTPADLYNIAMDIDARDFTLNELLSYALTAKGGADVLERSLVKAGKKKEEAKVVISQMDAVDLIGLAQQVMLSPKKNKEEPQDPNAGTAGVCTVKTPPQDSTSGAEASVDTTSTDTPSGAKTEQNEKTLSFGE